MSNLCLIDTATSVVQCMQASMGNVLWDVIIFRINQSMWLLIHALHLDDLCYVKGYFMQLSWYFILEIILISACQKDNAGWVFVQYGQERLNKAFITALILEMIAYVRLMSIVTVPQPWLKFVIISQIDVTFTHSDHEYK